MRVRRNRGSLSLIHARAEREVFDMTLFSRLFVFLLVFALGGVADGFAAPKPTKARVTRPPVARTAELGQRVEFTVTFSSTTEARLQWRRNRVPLTGATGASYVINTVLPADAGQYDVVITNGAGAVISRAAVLTVNLAPPSLPLNGVLYGEFTFRIGREYVTSDGAYVVTGATTLQDPEAPADTYTYKYTRLPKNRAVLVITGRFFDPDFGRYISGVETHTLTFTGMGADGELVAKSAVRGTITLPAGYRPARIAYTGTGRMTVEAPPPPSPVLGGSLTMSGSTLSLGGTGSVAGAGTLNLSNGALAPGGGAGALTFNGQLGLGFEFAPVTTGQFVMSSDGNILLTPFSQ